MTNPWNPNGSRITANQNPFVPGQSDAAPVAPLQLANTTTAPSFSMDPLPAALLPPGVSMNAANTSAAPLATASSTDDTQDFGAAQDDALMQVLDDDAYQYPNSLSALYSPAYKFRLFMTTEHDVLTGSGVNTVSALYKTLDSIPQVTIAETGVTAGFNISSVEIEQTCTPGWRNRSTHLQKMTMTINEPLGSSLIESIINAGQSLGIQNFAKVWYYVELTFHGYDENGAIDQSPLKNMKLDNGGRWVYQVAITKLDMHLDESGATYKLDMMPYSAHTAFDDDTQGRTIDKLNVTGGTLKEFCDDYAKKLTQSYTDRYLGEVTKFNIVIHTITDDTRDPNTFTLGQTEKDPQQTLSLNATDGKKPTANIPRGTTINDMVMFLYSHCVEAQKMMLDVATEGALEDGSGPTVHFNGKDYRVPIVPTIDADVLVTGYDPITGQYIREITYHVLSTRSYTSNLSVSQYTKIKNDPKVAVAIATELKKRGFLRKRYDYLYTGMNTEVLKFDLNYNFAFSNILPRLSGWAPDAQSISHHEKYNPALAGGAKMNNEPNETAAKPVKLTAADIGQKLEADNSNITATQDTLQSINDNPQTVDPVTQKPYTDAARQQLQNQLNAYTQNRASLQADAKKTRDEFNKQQASRREEIERKGATNTYAEDAVYGNTGYEMSYTQSHDEAAQMIGSGFTGQWHRGASLVGALLNQMYQPVGEGLINIELEIRGDPYWVGQSHLDRRALLNGAPKQTNPVLPDYGEGDATFALIISFPAGIDANTGAPIFRKDDMFNGLYKATSVKSTFSGGEFKQTLSAMKLPLITPLNNHTGSGAGNNGGTVPNNDNTTIPGG